MLVPAGGTGGLAATGVIMTRAGLPAAFTAGRMVALFLITAVATNVLLIIVAGVGVGATVPMLRARDPQLIVGALGFVLFDLALVAAFHAVASSGLPLGTMVLAYALGQVGSIVSLPGTTEGGLVGVFVLYGAPLVLATSAVLVYRALQSLVPIGLGLVGVGGLRQFFRKPALQVGVPADSDSI